MPKQFPLSFIEYEHLVAEGEHILVKYQLRLTDVSAVELCAVMAVQIRKRPAAACPVNTRMVRAYRLA